MGNRAYIVFENKDGDRSPAVYVHWNGGPESVYAFLDAHKRYGNRSAEDVSYAAARFVQIVGNYFGGTTSLGLENTPAEIETLAEVGDNGLYLVTPDGVRRCTHSYSTSKYTWMPESEAAEERKAAYAHEYHTKENPIADGIDRVNKAMFAEDYKLKDQLRAAVLVGELGQQIVALTAAE